MFKYSIIAVAFVMVLCSATNRLLPLKKPKLDKIWSIKGFETPESALYDAENHMIYVSNINGGDTNKHGGYISRLDEEGQNLQLKWAVGLDGPKGMGLYNGILYVADMTRIVLIDIKTGAITGKIRVEGAVFLNDITISNDGMVYISDMKRGCIYSLNALKYIPGSAVVDIFCKNKELSSPNGLLAINDKLMVLNMSNGKLFSLDIKSMQLSHVADSLPSGDGIIEYAPGKFMVSNWNGQIYSVEGSAAKTPSAVAATGKGKAGTYKGTKPVKAGSPDKNAKASKDGIPVLLLDTREEKINTADIGYIPGKKLLLVPTFFGNTLDAYEIAE
ncbi:MAG: hypothetical protein V4543_05940 [Bacteroidota bacterium]